MTVHPWVSACRVMAPRSRRRMSLRWSQPLRSLSVHAAPNCARLYPVIGPRPLTVSAARAASAVPGWARATAAGVSSALLGVPDAGALPGDASAVGEAPGSAAADGAALALAVACAGGVGEVGGAAGVGPAARLVGGGGGGAAGPTGPGDQGAC